MRGMQGDAQRMPKKTPAYMVYLHKHPERIDDVYKAEKNTSSKTGIALRNEIARRLFADESEEEKKACEDEAVEDLEFKKAKYEAALGGEISTDPEDQAQ